MISFNCDYMEGAHPFILKRLQSINMEKNIGYGCDPHTSSARERIRQACRLPDAEVHFLVGGTQTNMVVLESLLRFNQGVLAAHTGHINVHEAGAIEATGHKVIPVKSNCGKIDIPALTTLLDDLAAETAAVGTEHYVMPQVIYISMPTELGTIYTLDELRQLRSLCDQHRLYLYVDGARLGYGLMSAACDATLPQLANLADVLYIGGTKMGALMGEAVVVCNPSISIPRGLIKGRGAMLAKGWLLGIQFDTLFTDGLYFKLGRHAVEQAMRLRRHLEQKGYSIYIDSPTNQQFVVMPNDRLKELSQRAGYDTIAVIDQNHTVVRFCTSWATTPQQVDELIKLI